MRSRIKPHKWKTLSVVERICRQVAHLKNSTKTKSAKVRKGMKEKREATREASTRTLFSHFPTNSPSLKVREGMQDKWEEKHEADT